MKCWILAIMLFPRAVQAEVVCLEAALVQCGPRGCTTGTLRAQGTGVTIGMLSDGRVAVLTAGHNFRDARSVNILWRGGARLPGEILAVSDDPQLDAALLAVRIVGPWQACPLVAQPPPQVEVVITGFAAGQSWKHRGLAETRTGSVAEVVVRQGESGAPCVAPQLGCVGIVRGQRVDVPVTIFTPSDRIAAWLRDRGFEIRLPQDRDVEAPPTAVASSCRCGTQRNCVCDPNRLDQLAAEIERLKSLTFPVQTLTPDGRVFSEDTVRLGDPIQFRLVPKPRGTDARSSSAR